MTRECKDFKRRTEVSSVNILKNYLIWDKIEVWKTECEIHNVALYRISPIWSTDINLAVQGLLPRPIKIQECITREKISIAHGREMAGVYTWNFQLLLIYGENFFGDGLFSAGNKMFFFFLSFFEPSRVTLRYCL